MKRRALLAVMPLMAGCSMSVACEIKKGEVYDIEESEATVAVIDAGVDWADLRISAGDNAGEFHARKIGCDRRYCRYQLDSEFEVKFRFDCNTGTVDIYV